MGRDYPTVVLTIKGGSKSKGLFVADILDWETEENATRVSFRDGRAPITVSQTASQVQAAINAAENPSYVEIADGSTAPGAGTGVARIYVDSADGDLKVVYSDGTVKLIVADT